MSAQTTLPPISSKVTALIENKTVAETGKALIEQVGKETLLTSEVVDVILQKAVLTGASDVHIEPSKFGIRTRYRIDGIFQDLGHLPMKIHDQIVARVKVLADLISHKREVSQEGRITINAGTKAGDFRVSIVPTVAGEKALGFALTIPATGGIRPTPAGACSFGRMRDRQPTAYWRHGLPTHPTGSRSGTCFNRRGRGILSPRRPRSC